MKHNIYGYILVGPSHVQLHCHVVIILAIILRPTEILVSSN